MKYLHREIREKGGAYGGGANSQNHGLFHFYSYRDPNLQQTLDRFAAGAMWAASGEFTDRDIDEAKLSVFSQVDSPVSPGRKGMRYFLYGIDDHAFQSHREQLLEVGRNGVIDAAQTYLIDNHAMGSVAVLGPDNALSSESPMWTVKKHK